MENYIKTNDFREQVILSIDLLNALITNYIIIINSWFSLFNPVMLFLNSLINKIILYL